MNQKEMTEQIKGEMFWNSLTNGEYHKVWLSTIVPLMENMPLIIGIYDLLTPEQQLTMMDKVTFFLENTTPEEEGYYKIEYDTSLFAITITLYTKEKKIEDSEIIADLEIQEEITNDE